MLGDFKRLPPKHVKGLRNKNFERVRKLGHSKRRYQDKNNNFERSMIVLGTFKFLEIKKYMKREDQR